MTHLFQGNRVKLICSCGLMKPITLIYFCRHCLKLRCSNCVSHEIDITYCPNCLENMPSTEAKLKKNRCANCFDCPSCGHTLSSRTASVQVAKPDDPKVTVLKKIYYLGCSSCRWTTREAGLQDQNVATGIWGERDPPNGARLQELMDHYRFLAQKEKFENDRKKGSKKRPSYISWNEKYSSLGASFASKSISSQILMKGESASSDITPSEAVDEVPPLSLEVFTEPIDLCSITTLEQRFMFPEWQPESVQEVYPVHKHLLTKRSHRCKHCEHILSKPEYNTSSIKFKIHLGAYHHVPEIRIVREVPLKKGKETVIQISLCNRTSYNVKAQLLPYSEDTAILEPRAENEEDLKNSLEPMSLTGTAYKETTPLPEVPGNFQSKVKVSVPQGEFVLAAKDDTLQYGDTEADNTKHEDSDVVAWRKANKIGVNIKITPEEVADATLFGLLLRFEYKNTVATVASIRTVTMTVPVIIDAGKVE